MTSPWRPLLEGDLAARALDAVGALAAGLPDAPVWLPMEMSAEGETAWRSSLAAGDAGRSLFYAYLSFHGFEKAGDPGDTALELLDRATEGAMAVPMTESLFTGFPGIAWVAQHLEGRLFEADPDSDANREIDEALLALLDRSPWPGEYDLINGLAGLGVYALERLPHPSAVRCLERVIERLAERAERNSEGIAWFSPPEILPDFQREPYPKGLYNLGASHGIAGVIAVLAAACRANVSAAAAATARPLLDGAMTWLLARQTQGREFRFPHFYHPDVVPRTSRLAWCYGDPGMAAILLLAARAVGEPAWEREALDVALAAAARPPEGSGVRDAGLCHGAAGLGHLFNRLYQATGEERLAQAARSWYHAALQYRQPGHGIAGFRSWAAGISGVSDWRDDSGFLEGAAGVGLALLAALSPVDPAWDRLLLVNT